MRSSRPTPQQSEAVSRRLAQLSAELAVVRAESGTPAQTARQIPDQTPPQPALPPGVPDTHTRIRAHPEPVAPVAPLVPIPGRHAARRPGTAVGSALDDLVPATLRGRTALGSGALAVLAVAVALGLAVTCWWILRNDPEQVPAPAVSSAAPGGLFTPAATPGAPPGPAGASGAAAATAEIVVDVAGRVRRPGIAVLAPGSRVVDALEAAGGVRRGVDLSGLNLARLLVDGEQILVGAPPAAAGAGPLPPPSGAPSGAVGGALVNINTADQPMLETLPGVGPVTAQAIITWRTEHGGFSAVEELLEVDGIGDATLADLAPHVTV